MKIDVMLYEKDSVPFIGRHITVRVPQDIHSLNYVSVKGIMKDWFKRKRIVKEYWINNGKQWEDDGPKRYILISWSPIITSSALDFICQNF